MLLPKIYYDSDKIPLTFRQGVIFTGQEILALQEIAHILNYESIWVDIPDWQNIAQSIQYKLLMGENMSELSDAILQGLTYLGDHAPQITQTNDNNQTVSNCCGETANTGGDVVTGGGVSYTTPDVPPASYTGTPAEYEQARCYGANLIVDTAIAISRAMSDSVSLPTLSTAQLGVMITGYMAEEVTFVAGVGVVLAGGEIVVSMAVLTAIAMGLVLINFVADVALEYVADTIENSKQESVCALYNAQSQETATNWLVDIVNSAIQVANLSISDSILFRSLFAYFLGGDYLNQYFDGSYNPDSAIDCHSCEPLTCGVGDTLFLFENGQIVTGSLAGTAYVSDGKIFNTGQNYYFNLQQCAVQSGSYMSIRYTGNWTQSCNFQHKGTCGQGSSAGWASSATINLTEGFNPNCETIQSKLSRFTTSGTVNGITYLKITRDS